MKDAFTKIDRDIVDRTRVARNGQRDVGKASGKGKHAYSKAAAGKSQARRHACSYCIVLVSLFLCKSQDADDYYRKRKWQQEDSATSSGSQRADRYADGSAYKHYNAWDAAPRSPTGPRPAKYGKNGKAKGK